MEPTTVPEENIDQDVLPENIPTTGVTKEVADKITDVAILQLSTSRLNKRARLAQIKENEDLYHNIITEKSIRNPFNECFPYMAGFVDHLKAKIDDDSNLAYTKSSEADYKKTLKVQAFYDDTSKSLKPNDCWDLKHRHAKTNAIFSGVAIYKYFTSGGPYKSYLEVISHYDFHCEPRGGAQIENHLFCGQDNIFKTEEDLKTNKNYNQKQVTALLLGYQTNSEYSTKDNADYDNIRNNRANALGQQPQTHNFVGQSVIKFIEWYITYKNVRYYLLFNEQTRTWIRCLPLTEMFPDGNYPYLCWHTNEDPDVFWSKAPCDDARSIAKIINTMLNQELYSRQKENYGRELYDAEMVPNLSYLTDPRPDGKIPIDTKAGQRRLSEAVYKLPTTPLGGTLNLITWLEQFTGKQIGYTSSSAGQSESDKKVGVFQGEIEQIEELINIKNKSYRFALSILGQKFLKGLILNMDDKVSVQILGGKGIEWDELTREDLVFEKTPNITPVGGTSELKLKEIEKAKKLNALTSTASVSPIWKDRQLLLLSNFTEDDIKDAWSTDSFGEKELLSEAAQAEKDIVEGKQPKLNRGATVAFMQHILDFEKETDDLPIPTAEALIKYAEAHIDIVLENMNRSAKEMIAARAKNYLSTSVVNNNGTIPSNDTRGNKETISTPA